MDEYPSPRRNRLEDAIAKLLDIRDVLADEARREDRLAQKRHYINRVRRDAPTTHTQSGSTPRQRRRA